MYNVLTIWILAAVHFWQWSLAFKQRNYFKYVACTIWNIWGFLTFINRAIIFSEIKSPRGRGSVCVHLISFWPFSFRPFQNAPLFPKFFWFRSPVPIAKLPCSLKPLGNPQTYLYIQGESKKSDAFCYSNLPRVTCCWNLTIPMGAANRA